MDVWAFICTAVILTLMPGPDVLFVVTQSITRGWRAGVVFAAGLCSGLVVHTVAVSLGISVLLMQSPMAFTALKFTGASYLIYLGVKAFLARHKNAFQLHENKDSGKLYRKGILMNLLNPKVILFFLAFFPQFVDKDIVNPMPQMLVLGLIFIVQAFIVFTMIAALSDRLIRRLMLKPKAALFVNIFEALVYTLIGISLFRF